MESYDGNRWSHNGPRLLTQTYKKMCHVDKRTKDVPLKCANFTMLPKNKCYEIGFSEWQRFFDASQTDFVMNRIKGSYFVHIWSHLNSVEILSKSEDSGTVYFKLAEKFCPKVLLASDDLFQV